MFQFHLATHDNKKALLSIKVNDKEIASVFDQNHKDNHKNSMAGTNVVHEVKRGDQVQSTECIAGEVIMISAIR